MSTIASIVEVFRSKDVADLPSIRAMSTPRDAALWILCVGRGDPETRILTPGEISQVLRDVYGVAFSWQSLMAALRQERTAVAKRKKQGKAAFQIMQNGIDEMMKVGPSVLQVDPEHAFTAIRSAQEVFMGVTGTVRLCDPYVDPKTLDYVADMCSGATRVRLLTVNLYKDAVFRRDLAALQKERPTVAIDVRLAPSGSLHDRYIIHDAGMLLLGTSLNGLGKKQSFIVQVGEDMREATIALFDRYWNTAKAFT